MSRRQRAFIRHWTRLAEPPMVPEVRLHLADRVMPLWEALARDASEPELPPPYWAFAWSGGQALARYVLDHPDVVAGRLPTATRQASRPLGPGISILPYQVVDLRRRSRVHAERMREVAGGGLVDHRAVVEDHRRQSRNVDAMCGDQLASALGLRGIEAMGNRVARHRLA